MTDGKNITDVMKYVAALYEDVSRLMLAVDRRMTDNGFVAYWGSRCYWENSASVGNPESWIPRTFTRGYARPDGVMVFFNIYLLPKNLPEPVAVWGSARSRGPNALDPNLWYGAMAKSDTPTFLTTSSVEWPRLLVGDGARPTEREAATSEALAKNFQRVEYAAVPMLSLTDDEAVQHNITEPLLRSLVG